MPVFNANTLTRLLGSIEANRLMLLCGAGLSIPPPSSLISAVRVARACYDRWKATEELPQELRDDIDRLAGHFFDNNTFESIFINALVPWDDLVGEPNAGHAAVSDLLITRAAAGALSANFDPLIEAWSQARKVAMRGAITGQEATDPQKYNPLVKFHGCFYRSPKDTVWTKRQLQNEAVATRIASCVEWIKLNLAGKDLLIIGFWTDWDYLNDVLDEVSRIGGINSVTVVDPLSTGELEAKAPALWATLKTASPTFEHIQASGQDALNELRLEFSRVWARKFFALGRPLIEQLGKQYPATLDMNWTCEEAYEFRLDGEGRPYSQAAHTKEPTADYAQAAFVHLLLRLAKATTSRAWYELNGNTIRVVQGAGRALSSVRERYGEPPVGQSADIIICAGAEDLAVPARIIASGAGESVVRPAPGGTSDWLTLSQARERLAL